MTAMHDLPRVGLDDINTIPRNGTQPDGPWQPINLATLPDQPPVQPTLGNVGIVYPGKRHVFSGPPESAKTLAAYTIGLHVVRCGGNLLLIDFEMGAWDARNRLRELGCTNSELEQIAYIEPTEPADSNTMTTLLNLAPQLVIIDAAAGAYDLQGLDDNKRGEVEKFTSLYVKAFWKAGVATIVLDHVVKNSETRGQYAVGSERKVGGADVHLGFEVITPISRGGNGLYKIVTRKDRGGFLKRGTLANMRLESHPETHQITWGFEAAETTEPDKPFRPTHLMEKASIYLELAGEPRPKGQIEAHLGGRAEWARKAIAALVDDGFAAETIGNRGAKLIESVRAYREADQNRGTITTEESLNHAAGRGRDVAGTDNGNSSFAQTPAEQAAMQGEMVAQTDSLHARPTSSHLVPDGVVPPRPSSSPPYGGTSPDGDDVDDVKTTEFVPIPDNWIPAGDWIDELAPQPNPEPDDELPL